MDDISEKLAELLNDPESMKRVRAMAENLLGDEDAKQQSAAQNKTAADTPDFGLDAEQIAGIMSVMKRLKNGGNDNRARLLLALKPLLSTPKQEKVDTALKLLKIVDMLPFIKESGLFDI